MRRINLEELEVSAWSGGTTSQVLIWPEGACLSKRDFLFRVSTAVIDSPESYFSDFSGFERILFSLEGVFTLESGGEKTVLSPGDKYRFSGSDKIHSSGRGRDFNLIFKNGVRARADACAGVKPLILESGHAHIIFPFSERQPLTLRHMEKEYSGGIFVLKDPDSDIMVEVSGGGFIHAAIDVEHLPDGAGS